MPASSSATSAPSLIYPATLWPSWSRPTTASRGGAGSPGPSSSAWSACTPGRCGARSSTPRAPSSSTSGPGPWNGSRARPAVSPPPASKTCSRPSSEMTETPSLPSLPSRARVVIVGGGVIGTSVAYHLAQLGWTDVLLLEQGQLSCGTTWHAAGLVGQLRASENGTRLVQYSTELYARLEAETGLGTGFRRCGGVTVARTPDRMTQLRRTAATAEAYQLEYELISPQRARELYPIMRTDDLAGAIWLPGDGQANPTDLTAALARGARDKGITVRERTRVVSIHVTKGEIKGVRTDAGDVEAEVVVNCAGQWAKQVGSMAGVI